MKLTNETFISFAMKSYDNDFCKTMPEFEEDLSRFVMVKKLLNRDELNVQLTLNHIITQFNVFERQSCALMLFFKIDRQNWSRLKTFLSFLNLMPNNLFVDGIDLDLVDIDSEVMNLLEQI